MSSIIKAAANNIYCEKVCYDIEIFINKVPLCIKSKEGRINLMGCVIIELVNMKKIR